MRSPRGKLLRVKKKNSSLNCFLRRHEFADFRVLIWLHPDGLVNSRVVAEVDWFFKIEVRLWKLGMEDSERNELIA